MKSEEDLGICSNDKPVLYSYGTGLECSSCKGAFDYLTNGKCVSCCSTVLNSAITAPPHGFLACEVCGRSTTQTIGGRCASCQDKATKPPTLETVTVPISTIAEKDAEIKTLKECLFQVQNAAIEKDAEIERLKRPAIFFHVPLYDGEVSSGDEMILTDCRGFGEELFEGMLDDVRDQIEDMTIEVVPDATLSALVEATDLRWETPQIDGYGRIEIRGYWEAKLRVLEFETLEDSK
jgi:hypothetical protein